MKFQIISSIILFPLCVSMLCQPKFHHWRPFYGIFPEDAFVASVDDSGYKKYVAKLIEPNNASYTVPAEISCDYVQYALNATKSYRIEKFVEILCSSNPSALSWRMVDDTCFQDLKFVSENYCVLEGGGHYKADKKVKIMAVGKKRVGYIYHIGRVLLEKDSHMWGSIDEKFKDFGSNGFEILTYRGLTSKRFKPHRG